MTDEAIRPPPTHVTYYGISLFSSRTFWLNAADLVVNLLSATAIVTIIPADWQALAGATVAGLNILLRMQTVRPAVLIAPGSVAPVLVPKVGPPPPPLVTD
jgi:hypothetical protein